jgi:hypothetical protein
MTSNVPAAFLEEIEGLEIVTAPQIVRQKSRDYSWFSPVLARELADLVVAQKRLVINDVGN